jgi:hypothetical protein
VTRPVRPASTTSGALICRLGHTVGGVVGPAGVVGVLVVVVVVGPDGGVDGPVGGAGGGGWAAPCLAPEEHAPDAIRIPERKRPFTVAILPDRGVVERGGRVTEVSW